MCDLVNSNFVAHGKDAVKAIKLKLLKKSDPGRQMLALLALEMCMKNCGQNFHLMVIAKDVPHEMAKLVTSSPGTAMEVRDKTLVLIREWAQQIRHPHLQEVYDHVRSRGVRFPPEQLDDGVGHIGSPGGTHNTSLADASQSASPIVSAAAAQPLYTPRLTTAEIIGANLEKMDPADAAAIRQAVVEAEAEADAMERADSHENAVIGSPPSTRRGDGAIDFGGNIGVIRRADGMPLNFGPPPPQESFFPGRSSSQRVGSLPRSAPRGYDTLDKGSYHGGGPTHVIGFPADDQGHARDLLAAQRLSAEEAANRARNASTHASVADADLSSPEAVAKLKSDLAVASETVASLRAALAAIDVENDPGAVKAENVKHLAEQCRQMRPRVVALLSEAADESLLMAALALNDELSDVQDRRDAINAAASAEPEMRAALAASLAEEAAKLKIEKESGMDLVDLFDASASVAAAGSSSQSATLDASLVELLTPSEPLVQGKGKAPVVDPFTASGTGNPFAQTQGGLPPIQPNQPNPPGTPPCNPFMPAAVQPSAVNDPFANDPFAPRAQQPAAASGSSNPFMSVSDPFAAPTNATPNPTPAANPFAVPSPGGSGFGAIPSTPPGSGIRSNTLFNAGGVSGSGSAAMNGASRPSPSSAVDNDPFAALVEGAKSPPKK